jgi:hypothetical protein
MAPSNRSFRVSYRQEYERAGYCVVENARQAPCKSKAARTNHQPAKQGLEVETLQLKSANRGKSGVDR